MKAIVFFAEGHRLGLFLRDGDPEKTALEIARRYAPDAPVLLRREEGYVRVWAYPVKILVWRTP